VHVIEPDGTGLALAIPGAADPAWSADGARLAYFRPRIGLHVSNGDGTDETMIKPVSVRSGEGFSSEDGFREPAWTPDGGTIAYEESDFVCALRVGCHDAPEGVRAIGSGGGGDRLLFPPLANDPSYSPDGTRIAWSGYPGFGLSAIRVSSSDGTGDTVLTQAEPVTGEGLAFDPSWSPDGTRIAFARLSQRASGTGPTLDFEIWVMNADGSNQTRLTSVAQDDRDPAWSPDGTKIAWSRARTTRTELWVMSADGSAPARLTPDSFIRADKPDWEPLVGPRRDDYKNASHFCKAEREFRGEQEFSARYRNHGGCVSQRR
jgi:Tol biopolymer transport system component